MDDTQRLSAAFPIGNTTVTVKEPTGAQLLVLSVSRAPKEGSETARLVRRMFRIMEGLMGQAQWDDVIEDGVASETLDETDLLQLVQDVIGFPWAEHHKPQPTQEPDHSRDAAEVITEKRPTPHIVSGA